MPRGEPRADRPVPGVRRDQDRQPGSDRHPLAVQLEGRAGVAVEDVIDLGQPLVEVDLGVEGDVHPV